MGKARLVLFMLLITDDVNSEKIYKLLGNL